MSESSSLTMISVYEEDQLLNRVTQALAQTQGPPALNSAERSALQRLARKLKVRRIQRRNALPVFDLDMKARQICEKHLIRAQGAGPVARRERQNHRESPMFDSSSDASVTSSSRVLDRFQFTDDPRHWRPSGLLSPVSHLIPKDAIWTVRQSPYTGRELKPFIRRDQESLPLKLKLHQELKTAITGRSCKRYPVDFCYFTPHHVRTINGMANQFFWPGIDVTENLQYPDFSCVALYRQMVVGFAFLVPNVSHTDAYVSFLFVHPDWRRGGIAKFMIYHLIQSCAGRDITLHVSANNPAVMLYQNFGFKVEERILDFYDKYLPSESKECKHALFLRLSR
ncbi:hypothetical protein TCAL_00670 [Tigriopus californicus]|uniref:N-acetyltransferase domain-containing protein n=1 Tax=Tigriopus californicus TaxID=6832 RepID=A0A553PDY9_TIGCA|nr:cysteine-rich protein 2-binding protein-like [Tigriopus californicus]TRY75899.1 hypothetical protein TCAL_00670 [Tigriopus californicus]|eukprot:TCALIF_00670-PA protein Name:"Similar to CSRP2BP Cysteine-rich protein 2-binding protein (Homo sapiens)" AED:0.01 eAED:0.01 QI:144/1/0.75/1/1/1/4/0/338